MAEDWGFWSRPAVDTMLEPSKAISSPMSSGGGSRSRGGGSPGRRRSARRSSTQSADLSGWSDESQSGSDNDVYSIGIESLTPVTVSSAALPSPSGMPSVAGDGAAAAPRRRAYTVRDEEELRFAQQMARHSQNDGAIAAAGLIRRAMRAFRVATHLRTEADRLDVLNWLSSAAVPAAVRRHLVPSTSPKRRRRSAATPALLELAGELQCLGATRGTMLCKQGDKTRSAFFVVRGCCDVRWRATGARPSDRRDRSDETKMDDAAKPGGMGSSGARGGAAGAIVSRAAMAELGAVMKQLEPGDTFGECWGTESDHMYSIIAKDDDLLVLYVSSEVYRKCMMALKQVPPAAGHAASAVARLTAFERLAALRDWKSEELKVLADIARERTLEPGGRLFERGAAPKSLWFVISGTVALVVPTSSGNRIVELAEAPSYFCEECLDPGITRTSVGAKAVDETRQLAVLAEVPAPLARHFIAGADKPASTMSTVRDVSLWRSMWRAARSRDDDPMAKVPAHVLRIVQRRYVGVTVGWRPAPSAASQAAAAAAADAVVAAAIRRTTEGWTRDRRYSDPTTMYDAVKAEEGADEFGVGAQEKRAAIEAAAAAASFAQVMDGATSDAMQVLLAHAIESDARRAIAAYFRVGLFLARLIRRTRAMGSGSADGGRSNGRGRRRRPLRVSTRLSGASNGADGSSEVSTGAPDMKELSGTILRGTPKARDRLARRRSGARSESGSLSRDSREQRRTSRRSNASVDRTTAEDTVSCEDPGVRIKPAQFIPGGKRVGSSTVGMSAFGSLASSGAQSPSSARRSPTSARRSPTSGRRSPKAVRPGRQRSPTNAASASSPTGGVANAPARGGAGRGRTRERRSRLQVLGTSNDSNAPVPPASVASTRSSGSLDRSVSSSRSVHSASRSPVLGSAGRSSTSGPSGGGQTAAEKMLYSNDAGDSASVVTASGSTISSSSVSRRGGRLRRKNDSGSTTGGSFGISSEGGYSSFGRSSVSLASAASAESADGESSFSAAAPSALPMLEPIMEPGRKRRASRSRGSSRDVTSTTSFSLSSTGAQVVQSPTAHGAQVLSHAHGLVAGPPARLNPTTATSAQKHADEELAVGRGDSPPHRAPMRAQIRQTAGNLLRKLSSRRLLGHRRVGIAASDVDSRGHSIGGAVAPSAAQ